ncbi:hypothetical protein [Polaromonas sp.]|uniref:hypothetical protein n=1 Tax=Polaromonas sp. TaxID=1869339 RepID=UPI002CAE9393|nr:hypothetical protein [Polaromonas sp.]HQS00796.1 hypothetical protein [Polaromonas sp.]
MAGDFKRILCYGFCSWLGACGLLCARCRFFAVKHFIGAHGAQLGRCGLRDSGLLWKPGRWTVGNLLGRGVNLSGHFLGSEVAIDRRQQLAVLWCSAHPLRSAGQGSAAAGHHAALQDSLNRGFLELVAQFPKGGRGVGANDRRGISAILQDGGKTFARDVTDTGARHFCRHACGGVSSDGTLERAQRARRSAKLFADYLGRSGQHGIGNCGGNVQALVPHFAVLGSGGLPEHHRQGCRQVASCERRHLLPDGYRGILDCARQGLHG